MSILKGLLQNEEFLIGAGLLQQGSQGQNIGQAIFPTIFNTQKIMANNATSQLRKLQIENAKKASEVTNFNLKKSQYDFDKIIEKDENLQKLIDSDVFNEKEKLLLGAGLKLPTKNNKLSSFLNDAKALGVDVQSPEFLKMWMMKNLPKKGLDIQFDENNNISSITTGGVDTSTIGEKETQKAEAKLGVKDIDLSKTIQTDYDILQGNIVALQNKVANSQTGFAGSVISGFNVISDQFAQASEVIGDKFKNKATKEADDYLNSKGITKKAQNYAQIKSSIINLSYELAKIAEPGNPKYSEGDIKRQLDRIRWGGSRDQIIAGLQQVLEDTYNTASKQFARYNPEGDFGFENPKKQVGGDNKQGSNLDEDEKDPLKLR